MPLSQGANVPSVRRHDHVDEKMAIEIEILLGQARARVLINTQCAYKVEHSIELVTFKCRVRDDSIGGENPFTWKDVKTEDICKGKRVIIFALPGAFTPTCSSTHLPGYEKHYDAIKAAGVDEIYCLSVNDAFVMRQWGLKQGCEEETKDASNPLNPGNFKKVKLLPDGACLFTRGMGMSCTWDSERGFGERSWRYSMVVNDMKIEKLFIEGGAVVQNSGPDPFEVSDADTMLKYLTSK
eukprot:747626-Hanusia_phi.AAC.1